MYNVFEAYHYCRASQGQLHIKMLVFEHQLVYWGVGLTTDTITCQNNASRTTRLDTLIATTQNYSSNWTLQGVRWEADSNSIQMWRSNCQYKARLLEGRWPKLLFEKQSHQTSYTSPRWGWQHSHNLDGRCMMAISFWKLRRVREMLRSGVW